MTLKDIHNQIDKMDDQILLLLQKRLKLSADTSPFKKTIENLEREKEILNRLISQSEQLPPETIKNIFQSILTESKKLQASTRDKVLDNS